MVGERIRALWGDTDEAQRLPADPEGEQYQPPQQVEDPHTLRDSTKPTLLDRFQQNKWYLLTVAMLALAVLAVVLVYFGRYFATVLLHPWVQAGGAGAGVLGLGYYIGRSSYASTIRQQDTLTLYDPDEQRSVHFLGEFRRLDGSVHDVFVPHKGHRGLGNSPEAYTVGELSDELAQSRGHSASQEVRIRLHPSVATVDATERGRAIVQLTAGLEPDPFGRDSNVEATLPEMAATDTVTDLKSELEKKDKEVQALEDEIDQADRLRQQFKEMATKRRQELLDEVGDVAEMFEVFVTRQRGDREDNRQNGTGTDPVRQELERMDDN